MSKAREKRKIERQIKQEREIRENIKQKIKEGKIKGKSNKKIFVYIILAVVIIAAVLIIILAKSSSNVNPNGGTSAAENNNPGSDLTTKEAMLAKCLTEKGAIFYGASWCPHCANQKAAFGDAAVLLPYVECTDAKNQQACQGVTSIPDWRINGQQYLGEQSLANLATYSGCVY